MSEFKTGDRVRINSTYPEPDYRGSKGIVIEDQPNNMGYLRINHETYGDRFFVYPNEIDKIDSGHPYAKYLRERANRLIKTAEAIERGDIKNP